MFARERRNVERGSRCAVCAEEDLGFLVTTSECKYNMSPRTHTSHRHHPLPMWVGAQVEKYVDPAKNIAYKVKEALEPTSQSSCWSLRGMFKLIHNSHLT